MADDSIFLVNLISKLLIYLCAASLIGGWFISLLTPPRTSHASHISLGRFTRNMMLIGSLIGLGAVALNFFAQVGHFAEEGWSGMFNTDMRLMLWDSPVGDSALLRGSGFLLALLFIIPLTHAPKLSHENIKSPISSLSQWFFIVVILLLASGFTLVGHLAEKPLLVQLILGTHVMIALGWIGSLPILWRACDAIEPPSLQQLMQRFGDIAIILVLLLLLCGFILIIALMSDPRALISSSYGKLLMLKMLLVMGLLVLATRHKLQLVPHLLQPKQVTTLKYSIIFEYTLGIILLSITVLLTTAMGPAGDT